MKKVRKINLVLLFFVSLMSLIIFSIPVNAETTKVENQGATYRVQEVVEKSDLGYGLTYSRSIAFSSSKSGHFSGKDGGSVGYPMVADQEYQQQVNLIEMVKDSEVDLIPFAYLSGGMWNTSTIRNAAAQFEIENPGKKVIAAVNGDWFQIQKPVSTSSGVTISNGEYLKNQTSHGGTHTLVFDNDLKTGQRINEITDTAVKPMLAIYDELGNIIKEVQINKINDEPSNGEISLYFAHKKEAYELEVYETKVTNAYVIDKATKAVTTLGESFYGLGAITGYESSFDLGVGNFAIKTNNSVIDEYLETGVTVRCQFEYANDDLSYVENAIGFPYRVMVNGEAVYPDNNGGLTTDAKTRKPRSFLGVREDGSVVFAVVDGRQPTDNMYGMNLMEMAALMEYYGCVNSWKFDGGGSATMIIRKQSGFTVSESFKESATNDWVVVNSPSDSSERSDGNCLLMVVDAPQIELEVENITDSYVVFNVVLLSDLQRYTELYILNDGKQYQVKDGKVKIEGLKSNNQYEFFVYGKFGDELYNLGVRKVIKAALPEPSGVEIALTLTEKNGEQYIQIYYRVENKQAVRSIDIDINGKIYSTASSVVLIPKSDDFYTVLNNLEIKVTVVTSEYVSKYTLVFKDVKQEYGLSFIMDEVDFSINNFIKDIFISE